MRLKAQRDMTILSSLGRLTWLLRIKVLAFRRPGGAATFPGAGNAPRRTGRYGHARGHARDRIWFRAEFTWRLCAPVGTSRPGKCAERFAARPRLPGAAGGPVRRVALAGALWPDASEYHACSNLRSALSRLERVSRRALETDRLELRLAEGVAVDISQSRAASAPSASYCLATASVG